MTEINVLDLGADPTGTALSTSALLQARDAAETAVTNGSPGATIKLPPGQYRVDDEILMQASGIHWVGSGHGSTVISQESDTNLFRWRATDPKAPAMLLNGGCSNMTVRSAASHSPTSGATGIYMDHVAQQHHSGVHVVNFPVGFYLTRTGQSNVLNNIKVLSALANNNQQSCGIRLQRGEVYAAPANQNGIHDPQDGLSYFEPNSTYISNFDVLGYSTAERPYPMDYGIDVRDCDGLYMTNGHINTNSEACIRFLPGQSNNPLANVIMTGVFVDPAPGVNKYGIRYMSHPVWSGSFKRHIMTGVIVDAGASVAGLAIECQQGQISLGLSGCSLNNSTIAFQRANQWSTISFSGVQAN